jgi:hypothetical protein
MPGLAVQFVEAPEHIASLPPVIAQLGSGNTVTVNEQLAVLLQPSVMVHTMVVTPAVKTAPLSVVPVAGVTNPDDV